MQSYVRSISNVLVFTSISMVTVAITNVQAAESLPLANQKLIRVPLVRQSTDYTCGAAAVQSVIGYYGDDIREQKLAKEMHSNWSDGTNYENMVAFARKHGYTVAVAKDVTLADLKRSLDEGTPVICLIQAWKEQKNTNYANDWQDGHYVVAVGHDERNIYFMDPSTLGTYAYIPVDEFLLRWHDKDKSEKLHHFTLTLTKPKPAFDPSLIQKIE